MKYKISHITIYDYADFASLSHNELFLTPRNTPEQKVLESTITLAPAPSVFSRHEDFFGNSVIATTVDKPHKNLQITALSQVFLNPTPPIAPEQTLPWEQVKDTVRKHQTQEDLDAFQYVFSSPMIPVSNRFAEWAKGFFIPGIPILQAGMGLINKIYSDFKYDSQATTTATPVEKAFAIKKGVCQDFAHIGIACLRSLGLAARYVSGYLHTLPPPGKPKLIGADASHAWLALYVPGSGWVGLDPTNNLVTGDQHLTLAWGRDYSDVTPVKGTVLGGGPHRLSVSVDVSSIGEVS